MTFKSFEELVESRKSVRAFKPDPVPRATLESLFRLASKAPSNCNTQPWTVYVASGEVKDAITQVTLEEAMAGKWTPDIPYMQDAYTPLYQARQVEHLAVQQVAYGIERDDEEGRAQLMMDNLNSWGAPHVAFLFLPRFANEREAGDVGMFAQILMLAAADVGLGTCPQTSLGMFAKPIKRLLGVDQSLKLFFGLAIGYQDTENSFSRLEQSRVSTEKFVFYQG